MPLGALFPLVRDNLISPNLLIGLVLSRERAKWLRPSGGFELMYLIGSTLKRPASLAQTQRHCPNPRPVELMPVKAHVYRAVAELNAGFEKVIQGLQVLGRISFLRSTV